MWLIEAKRGQKIKSGGNQYIKMYKQMFVCKWIVWKLRRRSKANRLAKIGDEWVSAGAHARRNSDYTRKYDCMRTTYQHTRKLRAGKRACTKRTCAKLDYVHNGLTKKRILKATTTTTNGVNSNVGSRKKVKIASTWHSE